MEATVEEVKAAGGVMEATVEEVGPQEEWWRLLSRRWRSQEE